MYDRYFGFKERPFRLVPDPAYLFLSASHKEAMAHLVYAVGSGDGFVCLTGEVGTGKTTLCRAFLEQLDADTESGYIFNPPLDPVDLVKAINRDFGLPAEGDDLQVLIHDLNAFLIDKKGRGKTVLLIIDEAQNLNRHVLEQIRLLSNLETSRSKLLQIILVGQPELAETLKSRQLRQLHQRITLNCRLTPMTLPETNAYIRHRLSVASDSLELKFTKGAVRSIFQFSGGVPRLVNMVCDRALLTAYTADRRVVNAKIVAKAVKELSSEGAAVVCKPRPWSAAALAAAALLTVVAVLIYGPFSLRNSIAILTESASEQKPSPSRALLKDEARNTIKGQDAAVSISENPSAPSDQTLADYIETADPTRTRSLALQQLVRLWDPQAPELLPSSQLRDDLTFFQLSASQAGMEAYRVEDRLDLLTLFDLPAVLEFDSGPSGGRAYLVLRRFEGGLYLLHLPGHEETLSVDESALRRYWTGKAYVLWKNFFAISGKIPGMAPGESVVTLKLLLRDLGYEQVDLSPEYDETTRQAVMDVQARQNLTVDGVVGPRTKIALYNLKEGLDIPRLKGQGTVDREQRAEAENMSHEAGQ